MKKLEAIKLLGGSVKAAAETLDITTQAVYLWPEELSKYQERAVLGALVMAGKAPLPRGSKKPGRATGKSRVRNKPARVA